MLIIRTETFPGKQPEEYSINFDEKTIITSGGKKFHLVKIEELGVGYTFVALAYDTYSNRNLFITSKGIVLKMTEK